MSSNVSTPVLAPTSAGSDAAHSAVAPVASNITHDADTSLTKEFAPPSPLDDIPPLSLDVLTDYNDQVDALQLVADSIAQQRQRASYTLVFHPATLSVLIAGLAIAYRFTLGAGRDAGTTLMIMTSVVMTYLLAIRLSTAGYIYQAEALKLDWIMGEDEEQDSIIGAKYGSEMIAALVLRLEPNASLVGKKKTRALSLKGGKGVIRAWTTKYRYRSKGIGGDLLHEAIQLTRDKCGKDAEVGFAREHANSQMILPSLFNGPFRQQEVHATKMLEEALSEWDGSKRKRR